MDDEGKDRKEQYSGYILELIEIYGTECHVNEM